MIKPLFLIGPPRSGTTIFTQVLNSSSKVLITDELRVIAWFIKELRKIEEGYEKNGDPYPYNYGDRFALYLKSQGSNFIRNFYKILSKEHDKENFQYWGDKYPHFDSYLDKVPRIFPAAKYVFICRNISEIINSVSIGHEWTIEKSSNYVIRIYENYIKNFRFIDDSQIIGFHFHDLSDTNLTGILKVFEFLDVSVSEEEKIKIKTSLKLQSHSNRTGKEKFSKYQKTKLRLTKKELDDLYSNPRVILINDSINSKFGYSI